MGDFLLDKSSRFSGINLEVRSGEIVGVAGLVGAGRTELFRSVFGLDPHQSGALLLDGAEVTIRSVGEAIRHGILMVSEDRKKEGVVLCRSIRENISITSIYDLLRVGLISLKKERDEVEGMIKALGIKCAAMNDPVATLSGGNQQKVVLAKWLLKKPRVLILDEPTRGIDVGAKYEIYKLMRELAAQGVAIVMISSEMPEIIGMSDRVVVMSQGAITGHLEAGGITQEAIAKLAVKGFTKDENS